MTNHTLATLAHSLQATLGADIVGDGTLPVTRLAHPTDIQGPTDLAFATDKALLPQLAASSARMAVVTANAVEAVRAAAPQIQALLVVARPRYAMARLNALFEQHLPSTPGIHPTAFVEPSAKIGENVAIGPFVYVGANARIGANSILHPHVYIAPDVELGEGALLHSGVRIGARVKIGPRLIAHFNASIGADGFSFVTPQMGSVEAAKSTGSVSATNHELVRIASLGAVEIGADVEIGANTSIDRGTILSTRIGNGTKLDNQVQIGHNVSVGDNCLICGRAGIAGSSRVGNRVVLGGAVGVTDHVEVGDDSIAMGMSGIAGNIPPRSLVGGFPAKPRRQWIEDQFNLTRIKSLSQKIKALTARLDRLAPEDQAPEESP